MNEFMTEEEVTEAARVTPLRLAIAGLMIATAAIHLSRVIDDPEIGTLFGLNATGYLILAALLTLPIRALARWHRWIRWIAIVYTSITIVLYFVWAGASGEFLPIGLVDKVIEVALVFLLLRDEP